jgi:crotonobetainyl-CoA:carnitine CoA-transferase CaiB-like acyl-CoA transferase
MSGILKGIRVLDFGRYIAGPFCATLLADLGADVIRIEKPSGGEDRFTVPVTKNGEGAYFQQLGRNKRGMTLNPMQAEGRDIVRRLVATADVVVVNLPINALKKMGLDYDSLCDIKADIILSTASAFGSTGPYSSRGGFDTIAQAMSGGMYLSGEPDNPAKSFTPYCDFGTGSLSAFGTLAAIIHRMKTGEGQLIDGSLLSTGLSFNNAALIEQAMLGLNRVGSGTRGQYNAPTDSFKTADGWVTVQIVGQGLFKRWVGLVGDQDYWLNDTRFASDQSRGDHGVIIAERMQQWIGNRTNSEVVVALAEAGIPAGELLTPAQVLENEQVVEGGFFQHLDVANAEVSAPIANHPLIYSKTPVQPFKAAPKLGQHTNEILAELGFDQAKIEALRSSRIV